MKISLNPQSSQRGAPPGGELELGLSYIDKPDSSDAHSGWALTAQHKQAEFLGGSNTLALQYGRGPGTGLGYTGDVTLDSDNKSYRLVEIYNWQATSCGGGQAQFVYQKDVRPDGSDQDWLSVGGRTSYAFTDQFKLVGELGHDQVDAVDGTRKLSKLTVAPTWSPAGPDFWARPEIRLYYTYASWNAAAQRAASTLAAARRCPTAAPSTLRGTAPTLAYRSNTGGDRPLRADRCCRLIRGVAPARRQPGRGLLKSIPWPGCFCHTLVREPGTRIAIYRTGDPAGQPLAGFAVTQAVRRVSSNGAQSLAREIGRTRRVRPPQIFRG